MSLAADVASFFDQQPAAAPKAAPQAAGRPAVFGAERAELAGYLAEMQELRYWDPDEAMAWLSSVSARALEMMARTLESDSRHATKFRVEEVIPFRDECRFQFQVASRRVSILQDEWKMARGQES